jgi:hypothetical protein
MMPAKPVKLVERDLAGWMIDAPGREDPKSHQPCSLSLAIVFRHPLRSLLPSGVHRTVPQLDSDMV